MTNIVALIATTVLNLQTHLIPVKSNEALTDLVIIEQIPMTQAQRVEKAKALYEEGYDYFYGITRPMNRTKAVEYFGGAGKLENADAALELSYIYDEGSIVEQDEDKALFFLKKSAELGNQEAIEELAAQALASRAQNGQGNMDAKEAEYWIKKAGYTEEILKELDKLQEKSLEMFKKMQKPNQ